MLRFTCFIAIFFMTAILGWWVFFPLAVIYVYLVRLPYELIIMGGILDRVYYTGSGFFSDYMFTIFSLVSVMTAAFLEKKLLWKNLM